MVVTMISPHPTFFFSFNPSKAGKSLKNRLHALAQKWNFIQIPVASKAQYSSKPFVVHVVKTGDTLTSISVQYGVPMQAIVASNANIIDVDLVFEGQHLNIPINTEEEKKDSTQKNQPYHFDIPERCQSSLNILGTHQNHRIFTILSSPQIHIAKNPGCVLALVPLVLLIAFCFRCMVGTFHHGVLEKLKYQTRHESKSHYQKLRSNRWKSVLSDIMESNVADAETAQGLIDPPEDQSQVPFEDLSHAYTKLEPAYLKFLSECGMSKWGYWRGGSLE